jgi:hypothetical protein
MGLEVIALGLLGAGAAAKGMHDQKKAQEEQRRAMENQAEIAPPPGAPVYGDAGGANDIAGARQEQRKRLRGAMNTRSTMLSARDSQGGKTLLGQ